MNEKNRELAEILVDFATALESACINLKRYASEILNVEDMPLWDASKIKWEKAQGEKGEYEKASEPSNVDFQNLVKDLQAHGGRLRKGEFFYWLFEKTQEQTVGRKLVKKTVQQ
ncbi:MAG: hypothetical protein QXZ02_05285 [Candidatus Bathyarchaeia archaeon]